MKTLFLFRAVSGSGKTTLAEQMALYFPDARAVSADDFWYEIGNGDYAFDMNRLHEAHKWCQNKVHGFMEDHVHNIMVHNTFCTERSLRPYTEMAEEFGYRVVSMVVEHRHDNENVHTVPEHALEVQERNLRNSIKLR